MLKLLALTIFFNSVVTYSQEITRSTLGSLGSTTSTSILSQSVGQPTNTTVFKNKNLTLRQGFQQRLLLAGFKVESLCDLSVFPNPTSDFVTVNKFNNNEEFNISVIDINGKQIMNQQTYSRSKIVTIQNIPNGIYTIVAMNRNGESCVQQFIVVE